LFLFNLKNKFKIYINLFQSLKKIPITKFTASPASGLFRRGCFFNRFFL
jgi:hypothetical protein